ncbi:MerR family transcriptional regulator [Clostridium sp. CM028]|uniref:MerR family transcriptional regulator n=1 Tax=Clostridium sp. CM028 TaxID=2851575 RepID=UPI001C6E91B7|nr:MerR family transcriptional regulator [Clostridium sp. CM028]MBW9150276.1 MerR family transcriptional regulator [Clostridium sp. CM028]WLC62848.1 MerR family transcriptional regulator [Clostridium sp. CM028]
MKINEVMKETGVTKKAIYYYEEVGLIRPQKEEESNYRIYTMEDINRLITINALRKLDFSIKDIQLILLEKQDVAQVIKKQLDIINEKIKLLDSSKGVLENLIEQGIDSNIDNLRVSIQCLEAKSKNIAGYMQKELHRILPGNMGKMFAIHYGQFLDEPLDTKEKEKAWMSLINLLDAKEEVQYAENIKELIDEMFGKYSDKNLMELNEKSKSVTNKILKRDVEVSEEVKKEVKAKIVEYEKTPQYQKDLKFQRFMMDNIAPIFNEIEIYLCILSTRFEKFNKILRASASTEN